MRPRTFTSGYRDQRVKNPDFPLLDAAQWFFEDKPTEGHGVEETTMQTYRSWILGFIRSLPADQRTLASLAPRNVEAYVRTGKSPNTRMNRMVALKSWAKYLSRRRVWYAGTDDARQSVLTECITPRPSDKGQAGYRTDEIHAIERNVDEGQTPLRNAAVIAVLRHGFRAKEARLLLLRDVVLPAARGSRGHFVIQESGTKKGSGGVRVVTMSDHTKRAIVEYIRRERPTYQGGYKPLRKGESLEPCAEPLFVTIDGHAIRRGGWIEMARRFHDHLKTKGVAFRQHRLRSTRARALHEAGWADTDVMEDLGWNTVASLRRYVGRVTLEHRQQLPEPMDLRRIV